MRQHVWPCRYCPVAEQDLPSDYGKDGANGLKRITTHERRHDEANTVPVRRYQQGRA
jgi:hypothetical protein